MADKHDKTEAPTPKRKAKARKQGQVARSRDLVGWLGVLLATYLLPSTVSRGSSMGRELIAQVRQVALDPSPEKMLSTTNGALLGVISLLGPLLAGIVLLVIVGNIAQAGLI
jgi:flagellar biosynthetic protein FlhB